MKVTCSICMDCFDCKNIDNVNATACGHVFHEICLLHWLEMGNSCPTCRKPLRQKQTFKIFFDISETKDVDVGDLQNQLDETKAHLRSAAAEKLKLQDAADTLKAFLIQREEEVQSLKDKYMALIGEKDVLQCKLRSMKQEVSEKRQLSDENMALRSQVSEYENVRKLMNSTCKEAEELLRTYGDGIGTQRQLATYCCLLKRELQSAKESRSQLIKEVTRLRKEASFRTAESKDQTSRIKVLELDVTHLKDLLRAAERRAERLKEENPHATQLDGSFLMER